MRPQAVTALVMSALMSGTVSAREAQIGAQHTYVTACLADEEPADRMVAICERALDQPDASLRQRLDVMETLAWAHYHLDDEARARSLFDEILAIDPDSEDGLSGLGWLAIESQDYGVARDYFERAMNRSPNAEVQAGLAMSRYWGNDIGSRDALHGLEAALAIDPNYLWAMVRKGWVLTDLDRLDEAAAAFRFVIKREPDNESALYGVAFVESERDNWTTALTFVDRALEEDPDYVSALSRRSLILFYLDRNKEALRDAEKVIALAPDRADGYVRKARALSSLGRRVKGFEVLKDAEARVGYSSFLVYWRASLLLDEGRSSEALEQIDRTMTESEADFHDHLLRARIGLDLKDIPLARESIDAALALRPEDKWGLYYDAMVMAQEDRFGMAVQQFGQAVERGLSLTKLDEFNAALVGRGAYATAVLLRARYLLVK